MEYERFGGVIFESNDAGCAFFGNSTSGFQLIEGESGLGDNCGYYNRNTNSNHDQSVKYTELLKLLKEHEKYSKFFQPRTGYNSFK